jgi:hypothetical protein
VNLPGTYHSQGLTAWLQAAQEQLPVALDCFPRVIIGISKVQRASPIRLGYPSPSGAEAMEQPRKRIQAAYSQYFYGGFPLTLSQARSAG